MVEFVALCHDSGCLVGSTRRHQKAFCCFPLDPLVHNVMILGIYHPDQVFERESPGMLDALSIILITYEENGPADARGNM